MFTASAFKELLIPLLEDIKECFIYLPLKITKECNFSEDLKLLLSNCGVIPDSFIGSINKINSNRKSTYPDSAASLTDIFHYFLELEHISMRFSTKSFINTRFVW